MLAVHDFSFHKLTLETNFLINSNSMCQPMVCGAKSMPTSPQFEEQWRRKPYAVQNSSVMIQHDCKTALGPGLSLATQLWSAHFDGLICSAQCWSALCCTVLLHSSPPHLLLWWGILGVSAQSGRHSLPLVEGEVGSWSQRKAGQKSLSLFPDWSVHMQMRTPNS